MNPTELTKILRQQRNDTCDIRCPVCPALLRNEAIVVEVPDERCQNFFNANTKNRYDAGCRIGPVATDKIVIVDVE